MQQYADLDDVTDLDFSRMFSATEWLSLMPEDSNIADIQFVELSAGVVGRAVIRAMAKDHVSYLVINSQQHFGGATIRCASGGVQITVLNRANVRLSLDVGGAEVMDEDGTNWIVEVIGNHIRQIPPHWRELRKQIH